MIIGEDSLKTGHLPVKTVHSRTSSFGAGSWKRRADPYFSESSIRRTKDWDAVSAHVETVLGWSLASWWKRSSG